ncbi:hypothetical protein TYRP_016694 [Tyrophagus putrescentiae]|nr:hypothetical protein TYRP_016694 [Tyrophagus putrescentiae]
MANSVEQKKLVPIEAALDRRMNHGIVEYLVKLQTEDKLQWVPWTAVYCRQLMDAEAHQQEEKAEAQSTSRKEAAPPSSNHGIIDI